MRRKRKKRENIRKGSSEIKDRNITEFYPGGVF
jgi:hypothetical protein